MFEVVMKLLNRNQKTSKEIAKDRLKVVLIHDRANISPEVMQALKKRYNWGNFSLHGYK